MINWTRDQKIAIAGLFVAIFTCILATLVVPEASVLLNLDPLPSQISKDTSNENSTNVPVEITKTNQSTMTNTPLGTDIQAETATSTYLPQPYPTNNLLLGEAYVIDDVEVILANILLNGNNIYFDFVITNHRSERLVFSTMYSYAHLVDDLGIEYPLNDNYAGIIQQFSLDPGTSMMLPENSRFVFEGPILPEADFLIFTYDLIVGLEKLTWRIPVN